MSDIKCGRRQAQVRRIHGNNQHMILPVHFVCTVSRPLNVILLHNIEEHTGSIQIQPILSNIFPARLIEVTLSWVQTVDQDASNSTVVRAR